MGLVGKESTLYLIDFGLARRYRYFQYSTFLFISQNGIILDTVKARTEL
jgi:hypothetical protein